jgi:hypothetical protein
MNIMDEFDWLSWNFDNKINKYSIVKYDNNWFWSEYNKKDEINKIENKKW